jgi:CHASE3 domain sensor protein
MVQFIQKDAADDRINSINQRLNNIISTTAHAETGRGGYIITNTIDYLQSSNSAIRDIHNQLGNLDMIVAGDPTNQRLSLNGNLNWLCIRG